MTKQWNDYRDVIVGLYKMESKPLHEVRRIMEDEYNFKASIRAYRSRFIRWGIYKYACRKRKDSIASVSDRTASSSLTSTFSRDTGGELPSQSQSNVSFPRSRSSTPSSSLHSISRHDSNVSSQGSTFGEIAFSRRRASVAERSPAMPMPKRLEPRRHSHYNQKNTMTSPPHTHRQGPPSGQQPMHSMAPLSSPSQHHGAFATPTTLPFNFSFDQQTSLQTNYNSQLISPAESEEHEDDGPPYHLLPAPRGQLAPTLPSVQDATSFSHHHHHHPQMMWYNNQMGYNFPLGDGSKTQTGLVV
ncbi:Clr5 domain-containing protein [Diplogelasinospora grovesii]|uniref:Clr5 domain-containing protein n=1 Tax=Diplogelasinospora grovesii TaxID=303347 RepID=A0AAN6N9G9_9PEZI|nr:Clr5 domain-containing protein [Diplogelasinospora grovesii]